MPPVRAPRPKVCITFYLERDATAHLDHLASEESRSRANLITVLLHEALEARGVAA